MQQPVAGDQRNFIGESSRPLPIQVDTSSSEEEYFGPHQYENEGYY